MTSPPAALPDGFHVLGTEQLFAPLPPVDWLCQSLRIAPGAPTLFAGYGYSGKSVALQSLALSVASGLPLWGKWATKRGRVVHLDYEQGRRLTSERYQRMARAYDMDPRFLQIEACILPSVSLTSDNLCQIGDGRALILVDSWRAAHPGIDENSSEVRKSMDAMGLASEKTGATYILLHHTRKPNKDSGASKYSIRGSSGFYDGAQTIFIFDGEKVGEPMVTMEKDRLSGQETDPFKLRIYDTENGGLSVTAQTVDLSHKAAADYVETMRDVKRLIEGKPGTNQVEIAQLLHKKDATVSAIVSSMVASGEVVKVGKGRFVGLYAKGAEPPPAPF